MDTLSELKKEASNWRDVSVEIEIKGRKTHPRFWVEAHGQRRFVVYSGTSTSCRCVRNNVAALRRVLREIGAEKECA